MKVSLRYQNSKYDCGTTSFINALAYLYNREDIPVELLKAIYQYTLDVEDENGVIGKGGTSRKHAELLANFFVRYATTNNKFNINCEILSKDKVNLKGMMRTLSSNGVIVARCWMGEEHYVIITKIDGDYAYIFDPYYLDENYYNLDDDVSIVLHETFSHNRKVSLKRLFDQTKKDFSLLKKEDRKVILITK